MCTIYNERNFSHHLLCLEINQLSKVKSSNDTNCKTAPYDFIFPCGRLGLYLMLPDLFTRDVFQDSQHRHAQGYALKKYHWLSYQICTYGYKIKTKYCNRHGVKRVKNAIDHLRRCLAGLMELGNLTAYKWISGITGDVQCAIDSRQGLMRRKLNMVEVLTHHHL